MAGDSNFPAIGLQVDLDDFATADRAIDKTIENYGRLGKAARAATQGEGAEVDKVAQRRVRATEAATQAQLFSARQVLAAQRGLTNFQQQQDSQVLRSRQSLARQQADASNKAAKDAETAATRASRAQQAADRAALVEFRRTMDQRIAAGRAAARQEQQSLQQTYALRRRLTAQQAAESARQAAIDVRLAANLVRQQQQRGPGIFDGLGAAVAKATAPLTGLRNALSATRSAIFDVRTAVGVFLGGLILGPIVRFADAMVALEARIGFFAGSAKEVPYLFEAVYQAAQRSRAPLEALGTLYTRLAPLATQLGKSQRELIRIAETVQKGIAIGGATPEEAKSSAQQLAQALASNRLGGDELRSLAENAPLLLGAIAKELNMNTGQFIKWAQAGKANAEVVIGALEKAAPRIDKLFSQFPVTISQGLTVLGNALEKYIGEVNRGTKIGETVGASFVNLSEFIASADSIQGTVKAINALGTALTFIGNVAKTLISYLPAIAVAMAVVAARAILMSTAVQGAAFNFALLSAAVGRGSAAMIVAQNALTRSAVGLKGALGTAFGFFGGPIGVAIIAVASAVSFFADANNKASKAASNLQDSQQGAVGALQHAIAFTDAYGVSNDGLNKSLTAVISSSSEAAKKALEGVDATDKARLAAVQRAEQERLLTISILRRSAAESTGRAGDAGRAVLGAQIQAIGLEAGANSFFNPGTEQKAKQAAAAKRAEVVELKKLQADENALAKMQLSAASDLQNVKLNVVTPPAVDPNDPKSPAAAHKKTEAERRAESLAREAQAMNATIAATIKLAQAYNVSDAAALHQMASVEASGKAIKRQGGVEEAVARQAALNAAQAAADAARRTSDLTYEATAQTKANASVRAGLETQAQANERLAIEAELRPLIAQATAAQMAAEQAQAAGQVVAAKAATTAKDELNRQIIIQAFALQKLTRAQKESADAQDLQTQRDNKAAGDLELANIGKSNREQTIALAILQKQQELKRSGRDTSPDAAQIIKGAGDEARQADDKRQAQDLYNASLTRTLDILTQLSDISRQAGADLASAFGPVGEAIGNVSSILQDFAATQERIRVETVANTKEFRALANDSAADPNLRKQAAEQVAAIEMRAAKDSSQARIKSYGDIAAAGKNLFSEQSRGYKLLQAAEQAFRAFEFAMSVKSIAIKTFETAAKVGLFGTQAAAAAGAGAAEIFAALGPFAFPVVAAMVAVLAGLGVALAGGGAGAASGAQDAANRQKAQGTGSVLGDSTAKSNSIAKSLEIMASNTNKDLEFSNGMLKSLRSIDSQMSALAAGLARTLQTGGSLDTSNLGLGSSINSPGILQRILTPISNLLPGLFGSKTTKSLQDQGLQFGSQNIGDILSGGVNGQTFQQVLTNTKKKFFGVTYSETNKTSTTTGALDPAFAKQVSDLIGSLRGAVLQGADILGVQGAAAVLDAFEVNLGKLSFKDLSGTEIQDALNAIFSKLGDDLATAAIPALASLQKVGEGAFETLARVVRDYQVLDTSLKSIGLTFGAVGVASLAARERLIDLAGGIDAFAEQTAYFADNFLSDVERMAPVQRAVQEELNRLGLQNVTTKEQFKNVVLGLDLTTQAGAETYAALMALAPAFAKVVDFAVNGSEAVNTAREALQKAYDAEAEVLNGTIDRLGKLADGIKAFREGLDTGAQSGNNIFQQEAITRAQFMATAAAAATGNETALGNFTGQGGAYLDAAKAAAATLFDYLRAKSTVQGASLAAEAAARAQVSMAQQQLDALNAQVSGLLTINQSVLSVTQAIINLQAALAAQGQATAPTTTTPVVTQPTVQPPPVQTPSATTPDYSAYLSQNPDVLAEYNRNLASSKGRAELSRLNINSAADFAAYHYNTFGKGENRTLPTTAVPLVRTSAGAAALGGGDAGVDTSAQMAAVVDGLDDLKAGIEAVAGYTFASYKLNQRWDGDGMPETRNTEVSAP